MSRPEADDGYHRASRSRQRGQLRRRACGPGAPPPEHHRPGRQLAADLQRGPHAGHHVQRRDLQLPAAARGAARAGPHLRHRGRYGGDPARLRAVGRGRAQAAARHVRLRDLGYEDPHPVRRPRPLRHQAVLLCADERHVHVRLGDQGTAAAPRLRQGTQRGRAQAVYDVPVPGDSRDLLQGRVQAARGALLHLPGRPDGHPPLL